MPESPQHIAVLGGGPCGLYAARVLSRAGYAVTVLDKGDRPGGLATVISVAGNWYDMGCHMLHEFDQEIYHDIMSMMGDESIPVQLDAKIRWAGNFYRYPLQPKDMLRGINLVHDLPTTCSAFSPHRSATAWRPGYRRTRRRP